MRSKMITLLAALLVFNTLGFVSYEQAKNRANTITEVVCNGVVLELNVDEFKEYQLNKEYYLTETLRIEDDEKDSIIYLGEFLLTGYCDCPICQEEWVGTTALGIPPTENNTIAVDPDIIPLGSYVWINGIRYHAEDVGSMINEYHIDIFCGSHEECYSEFCNGYADVYIEVGK